MPPGPIWRVALIVGAIVAVPVTTLMWDSLLVRAHRVVAEEGLGGLICKCAIALVVGLLHWLATREKEEAQGLIEQVIESQGPVKGRARPKAD
mmetsp:Transcript_14540/g.45811  ORF Transcript_14540/g.45811 Transcript_14540/m.45811 type:complete len:93 (+) Transcript_14540:50-328(+)